MGTIDYTRRAAGLGNIRGAAPRQIANTSAAWRGLGNLGQGLASLGQSVGNVAVNLSAQDYRRREEARRAGLRAQLVKMYDDIMMNGYDQDSPTQPDFGEHHDGLLTRKGNAAEGVREDFRTAWNGIREKFVQGTDYPDDTRAWLQATMDSMEADADRRLSGHLMVEREKFQLGELQAGLESWVKTAADKGFDADSVSAIGSAATSYFSRVYGGDTMKASEAATDFVNKTIVDYVKGRISTADSDEEINTALGKLREFGIDKETRRALTDLGNRKSESIEANRLKEATDAINAAYDEKEVATFIPGKDGEQDPNTWPNTLREWAKDPELQRLNPKRALAYMNEAQSLDAAAARKTEAAAEQAHKVRIESIYRDIVMIEFLRASGGRNEAEIRELQRRANQAIRADFVAGRMTGKEYEVLNGRLKKELNEQQQMALREFYHSFGVTASNLALGANGSLTAGDQNFLRSTMFYTFDGVDAESEACQIDYASLVQMGDDVVRTLDTMGEGAYRPEIVREAIRKTKANWLKENDMDARRSLLIKTLRDTQRESLMK